MPYFLLIPAFLGWVVVCSALTLTTRLTPSLKPWYPYVLRICIWATVGTLVANVVFISLLALGVQTLGSLQTGSPVHDSLQVMWGLSALLGPFAVSTVGWIGGACFGMYLALGRRR